MVDMDPRPAPRGGRRSTRCTSSPTAGSLFLNSGEGRRRPTNPESPSHFDDGTTSNADRLGAIGDVVHAIERAGTAPPGRRSPRRRRRQPVFRGSLGGPSCDFWRGAGRASVARGPRRRRPWPVASQYGIGRGATRGRSGHRLRREAAQPHLDVRRDGDVHLPPRARPACPRALPRRGEGNAPDQSGSFIGVAAQARAGSGCISFPGSWVGHRRPAEQLLEADNRLRRRAGTARARRVRARALIGTQSTRSR